MSAHETCGRPGKFDCDADEYIYGLTLDEGVDEGDVWAETGWWSVMDLSQERPDEDAAAEHYGARHIIARENNEGRFWVEVYATAKARDERAGELEKAYRAWYSDSGEDESWDAR